MFAVFSLFHWHFLQRHSLCITAVACSSSRCAPSGDPDDAASSGWEGSWSTRTKDLRAELVLFIYVPLPERCERTHVYSCFCALTSFDFHSLSHSHLTTFLIALKLRAAARKTNSVSVSGQLAGPCFEFMFWLLVVRREIEAEFSALKFVLSLSSTHCIGFEEMGVKMHSTQCLRAAVLLCLLGVTIESRLNCDEVKKVFQLRQIGPSMWLPEIPRSGEHSRTLDKTGTQSALSTFCAKYRS